ncbi:SGNH/GDSL hydrolase family protein [Prosthecobacter sp.]|uniref:SGNH/GDSL hydrolase family protein n=1 Tax=Prosthecobacter sp. TaxID=1965333 RepID=UPI002AB879F0|nr:SGNH/GDSL hydrolase family protein [Prosthecobacter sp.]MDZ4401853.1 SGNH/GDSL hydrolase family protein [Prosthecobacter sp.]
MKSICIFLCALAATALAQDAPKPALPKVVLLGDSVREHYAPFVAELLADRATVVTPKVNGGDTGKLLTNLNEWAIKEQPDVVHFNSGIHDTKRDQKTGKYNVPPEKYEANLREIVKRLRAETKAKIVFALSTPLIDERSKGYWKTRSYQLFNASVMEYNVIALRVMKELDVPVNDLPAALGDAKESARLHDSGGIHFTDEGSRKLAAAVATVVIKHLSTRGASMPTLLLKTEAFDRDPGWEGHNNRIVPEKPLIVTQDFGYSATNHAGKAAGEIGGSIQRSTTPASYAAEIPAKTLDDKFTASGSFAVTKSQPGAGIFFGFFNSNQPGGSGRPIGSLGLDFDFEGKGGRLATRLITNTNKSCGTFITPYLPGKFRPTPIKNDGTRYHWTLAYDPQGAGGNGQFTFTMRSDTHTTQDYGTLPENSEREAQARFPNTKTFTIDLTPGFRKEGATFDRFGVLNMMKSGGATTMFFDDVKIDGRAEDFSKDPRWVAVGNRTTYEDREVVGAHDFGFSATTNHAGGQTLGEVGGGLWRSGDYGYYADKVGPLNLEHRLEARGKVKLVTAGPDSDMHIGWFSSATKDKSPDEAGNFIGIHVGGPTRIGHYFIPQFATATGTKGKVDSGPVLTPGKLFDWSLVYDPAAGGGNGEMRVTLGTESATLALKPGQKKQVAILDRFGLFTSQAGGQMVKIFLDDLQYSAAGP